MKYLKEAHELAQRERHSPPEYVRESEIRSAEQNFRNAITASCITGTFPSRTDDLYVYWTDFRKNDEPSCLFVHLPPDKTSYAASTLHINKVNQLCQDVLEHIAQSHG
ncbi:MAG TPA: hypothetical protein VFV38_33045 [Ktedonobacteraceae bacterium]|nr:hypothetical protein [Ktedonobacteraceae bacterium]